MTSLLPEPLDQTAQYLDPIGDARKSNALRQSEEHPDAIPLEGSRRKDQSARSRVGKVIVGVPSVIDGVAPAPRSSALQATNGEACRTSSCIFPGIVGPTLKRWASL
jgi:hypothetical protein